MIEHKYDPNPALEKDLQELLNAALKKERKVINTYFRDIVNKHIREMEFERNQDIKKLMVSD